MNKLESTIISGASGFIGRTLARYLNGLGVAVHGTDSGSEESAPLADLKTFHQMRLPSEELSRMIIESKPDLFVHCAGRASVPLSVTDPRTDFFSGPVLTWEILNTLRLHAPDCRFIFLSSAAVYGCPETLPVGEGAAIRPISPYGAHKHQSELIAKEFASLFGIPTASLRIFSAYGPGLQRQVMWDLCHKALTRGEIVAQGSGQESRDFIHVRDICEAMVAVATNGPLKGEVYNLGSGEETTISQLSELVVQGLGIDCPVSFSGNLPPGTPLNWRADISRLESLGFKSKVAIDEGVKSFANWCKAQLK